MKQTRSILLLCSVILVVCWVDARALLAQGSAFSYQGRLTESNSPANGRYDLKFSLFNAASNGNQIGSAVFPAAVAISNGLFTVTLDFGGSAFDGSARWLEVEVRTNGSLSAYTTLAPRQRVWPTPYAMHAASAAGLTGNPTLTGTVTFGPASGPPFAVGSSTKVNNLNADWLDGLDSSAFAPAAHDHDRTYWRLLGNSATSAGVNFLGTTDNQPLELKVNGQRALRLEPNANGAPNLIGGASANFVAPGTVGAVVAGGGATNYSGLSYTNSVAANFSAIGGGRNNTIQAGAYDSSVHGGNANTIRSNAYWSTIGGGINNEIQALSHRSTIGGGENNAIGAGSAAPFSTIAGGWDNTIQGGGGTSTIGGGEGNTIQTGGSSSAIGGGAANTIMDASYSTISGGDGNEIQDGAYWSAIGGGAVNRILAGAYNSVIGGGVQNTVGSNALQSTIGGGLYNKTDTNAQYATVVGGRGNLAGGIGAFVGGGGVDETGTAGNAALGAASMVGGGVSHVAKGNWSTIGGGASNSVLNSFGTVGGGQGNTAGAYAATIGGGRWNYIPQGEDIFPMASTISGGSGNRILPGNGLDGFSSFSTISGGESNTVWHETDHAAIGGGGGNSVGSWSSYCSIGGGSRNSIAGSGFANPSYGTISGGYSNSIRGGYPDQSRYGSIPGGYLNSVAGSYSLAAGCRAKANHSGSFVWADSSSYDFVSTNANSFSARCTGGARFVTSLDGSGNPFAGVVLPPNSGSWSSLSDRNAKERLAPVRGKEILQALAGVPMSTWNYKGQEQAIRHIGPMAQDFAAAFKVGEDDRTISTVDADGVALAAIQGLNEIVTDQQAALAAKDARIEALERSVSELRGLVTNLVVKVNGGTQ